MHPDIERRLSAYLDEQGLGPRVQKVVPLTGDASDRKYFRVQLRDRPPVVLAVHAGPIDYAALPFVRVAELMGRIPLPIPQLRHHSDALGIIGQEDLGDLTLQAHLGASDGAERASRYREAVAILATLQRRGAELASDAYPPYGIAFDVEKLTWELEFFVRHFLIAYRGATPSEAERDALREEWAALVEELAGEPRVLCHRDYHSRNLMLHEGRLVVIDFQDARMGPDTYDLVSLLRDSYVDVPGTLAGDLVDHFLALTGRGVDHRAEFERRLDLMGLQRTLKALGTFGFQTTSRGNPVYLQYVPRTLGAVRAALDRQPRFGRLRTLLAGLADDLR